MFQDPNPNENPQLPIPGQPVEGADSTPKPAPEKALLQNPEFLWTVGLLALVMLGGAIAIGILDKWRRKQVEPGRWNRKGPELSSFRDMLETGEITKSEYEKIRDKMSSKMKMEVGLKKIQTNPATPEPPTAPSEPSPPSEKT